MDVNEPNLATSRKCVLQTSLIDLLRDLSIEPPAMRVHLRDRVVYAISMTSSCQYHILKHLRKTNIDLQSMLRQLYKTCISVQLPSNDPAGSAVRGNWICKDSSDVMSCDVDIQRHRKGQVCQLNALITNLTVIRISTYQDRLFQDST